MIITVYIVGAAFTSAYTAYLLKTNEVSWTEIAPSSLSMGPLWPITLPVVYSVRSALQDP